MKRHAFLESICPQQGDLEGVISDWNNEHDEDLVTERLTSQADWRSSTLLDQRWDQDLEPVTLDLQS